ncbi:uncharacterized protein [Dysidea avara]|uniref:uncharacterized protein isoform X2 n=1 Tax=Dysidea avara TaxID=196820 RepID=UPI00332D6C8F
MPHNCCVINCRNRGSSSFYRIPAVLTNQGEKTQELSANRRRLWITQIKKKNWEPTVSSRVCSLHFLSGKPSTLYDVTNPDWLPTLNMGYQCRPANGERYARAQKRRRQKLDAEAVRKQASLSGGVCNQTSGNTSELSSQASGLTGDHTSGASSLLTSQNGQTSGASDILTSPTGQTSGTTNVLPSQSGQVSRETSHTSGALTSQTGQPSGATNMLTSHTSHASGGARWAGQTSGATNVLNIRTGQASGGSSLPIRTTNQPSQANGGTGQTSRVIGQTSRAVSQSSQARQTNQAGQAVGGARLTFLTSRAISELTNQTGQAIVEALLTNQESGLTIIRRAELEELRTEKTQLLKQVSSLLKDNKQYLEYYTGFVCYEVLKVFFDFVSAFLPVKTKLSKFSQVVMFLMKLRQNHEDEDIGYRFGVSCCTVVKNFHRVLEIMYVRSMFMVQWPLPEILRMTMPIPFRSLCRSSCVIVDCMEVSVEYHAGEPTTVKFLIGITPQGTFSFASKCIDATMYGKEIVEQSELMKYLQPGDVVIAGRNFTHDQASPMVLAEVTVPSPSDGVKRLQVQMVDWIGELAAVKTMTENVIGLLKKKYKIFQGVLPTALINNSENTIYKIVNVCCACVNLNPSETVPPDH